jgi:hypothetical protein
MMDAKERIKTLFVTWNSLLVVGVDDGVNLVQNANNEL